MNRAMENNLKILFAGGGTGGHLFSGIAVADLIRKEFPEASLLFVGTPRGLEKEIVPACGYPLKLIQITPLKGSGLKTWPKTLWDLPKAYAQAKSILRDFQPDIVLGIGGYASGPVVLAAHRRKIFTAIIEQNSYPGLTNRILGRFVDKIFIAFQKAREFFPPQKTFLTGNPVRNFPPPPKEKPTEPFTVFVFGGSQGAHALNQALIQALPRLEPLKNKIYLIHQTGKNDFTWVKGGYEARGFHAEVFSFSTEVAPHYQRAHLALCRAGAGTVAELRLQGLPSILVPYPFATDNHQYFNAKEMVDQGAALLCPNEKLTGDFVAEKIIILMEDRQALKEMGERALAMAHPDAAREILDHCLETTVDNPRGKG
jgi:UDP-N-acetylglucosamine--N-acetylmuramyl-(pentapeptide) pyrophosphoryl-undecaprenol N-acetylglucosamine transferase